MPTTSTTLPTIGANQTVQESNSSATTMPAAQMPEDNSALIGGIVGGALALLLIGTLIAFCAVRSRQQPKDSNASALPPESNYGRVPPAQSNYSEVAVQPVGAVGSHYDVLNANEL